MVMATPGFRSFVPILVGLLVLTAVGLAVERTGAFPLLRLALQRSPADLPSSVIAPVDAVARGDAVLSVFIDERKSGRSLRRESCATPRSVDANGSGP